MKTFLISTLVVSLFALGAYKAQRSLTSKTIIYEVDLSDTHLKIFEKPKSLYGDTKSDDYTGVINGGSIFIERKDFSVDNLNKIFRWYSRRFSDDSTIYASVFTDPSLTDPLLSKQAVENEYSWTEYYRKSLLYGAKFYRNNKGENEFYRYNDDGYDINNTKSVVLKGMDPFCRRKKEETKKLENTDLELQINSFISEDVAPNGIYNIFQVKPVGQGEWKSIVTMRSSSQIDVTKKYIYRINDKIFYFVSQWVFAVTFDNGASWIKWDGMDKSKDLSCCAEDYVKDVNILPDGRGQMKLNVRIEEPAKLFTKDFGKSWSDTP